jgi:uncharacterized protein (TIGR03085 family)
MRHSGPPFDAQERAKLCDLFAELGPAAPTLIEGWSAKDLAAHLVLREHDLIAAPGLVLPGPFSRFAERRRATLVRRHDYAWLVDRVRSGPPPGFFRVGWVRAFPNLNEYFVHHEDVRRANAMAPRPLDSQLNDALWRNVRRGSRYLGRRLRATGLEIERTDTGERFRARRGEPTARLSGPPGELLLFLFGRSSAARVDVTGSPDAVAVVPRAQFGMGRVRA